MKVPLQHIKDFTLNHYYIQLSLYKYLVEKYTLTNGIFSSGKIALVQFSVRRFSKVIGMNMIEVRKFLPNMLIVAIVR